MLWGPEFCLTILWFPRRYLGKGYTQQMFYYLCLWNFKTSTWGAGVAHSRWVWLNSHLWAFRLQGITWYHLPLGFLPFLSLVLLSLPMMPFLLPYGLVFPRFWLWICGLLTVCLLPEQVPTHGFNYYSLLKILSAAENCAGILDLSPPGLLLPPGPPNLPNAI